MIDTDCFLRDTVSGQEGKEDADGGHLAEREKGQVPSGSSVCSSENITHITQHASQRLPMFLRPPPITDSAETEHLPWKSQCEEEKGEERLCSGKKGEYDIDS